MLTVYVKHPHGCGWSNGSLLSGVNKPNMLRGYSPLAPPQVQSVGLVVKRGDIRLICTNSFRFKYASRAPLRDLSINGGSLRSAGFPPPYARRRAAFRELDICPSPVRR